jgi:dienelactone hydrolase
VEKVEAIVLPIKPEIFGIDQYITAAARRMACRGLRAVSASGVFLPNRLVARVR